MRTSPLIALVLVTVACGGRAGPTATAAPTSPPAEPPHEPDPPPPALRLPADVLPVRVALDLTLVPDRSTFSGRVTIEARVANRTKVVWLNATQLAITHASLDGQPARVIPGGEDFVGFTTNAELPVGPLTVDVAFTGEIDREKSRGIYAVEEAGTWYAYTFFEAIDARRAFPCFDQPDAKVPWQLTFHVKREHVALANAPVASETDEADGMKRVVLDESRPMPSYLVAFMVGPFDVVDGGTAGRVPTPIRFVVPAGRKDELGYARSITPKVVAALEDYFDMDYPYGKLDVAVVPRYWGTMEHPGIVAMGQPLILIKPSEETRNRKEAYTNILAHELSHYWFGDLVTLAWWDGTWLNESLGTWLDLIITDRAEPSWHVLDHRHQRSFMAMRADELHSTKSIRQPVDSREEIQSSFDNAITYFKGQTVLHMFESWVGADKWRAFILAYMKKYAWKNATADDFLATMTEVLGDPVTSAFRTFLDQPAVPLVEHQLRCAPAPVLELTQRRAFADGAKDDTAQTWSFPVCVRYGKGKQAHTSCVLMTAPTATLALDGGECPTWLVMNADGIGYYRSRYTAAEAAAALSPKAPTTMPDRSMMLADVGAAIARDELGIGDAMAMVPLVLADRDDRLRGSAWSLTGPLKAHALDDALYRRHQRWILATFGRSARELGWRRRPDDSDERQELRGNLVSAVAWAGDRKLAVEARKLARAWLADPTALEDDIVDAVLSIATRDGDAALFDSLLAAAKATKDRQAQQRLLRALGGFTDPKLAARALDLVLGTEFDLRESNVVLFLALWHRETRELAWKFVQERIDDLLGKMRNDGAAGTIGGLSGMFCDETHRAQAKALFEPRVAKIDGAQYALEQGLERSRQCIATQARLLPSVTKFLSRY